MAEFFDCPYLGAVVECTDERYAHVAAGHDDFAPVYWGRVGETLFDPDQVRESRRDVDVILFFRWYFDVGRFVAVVVNVGDAVRRWVMTAYFARRAEGYLLWARG